MTDQPEFEELEHIPWAALAAKPADPRARYGATIIGIIAAVGLLLWLVIRNETPAATLVSPATTLPNIVTTVPALPAPTVIPPTSAPVSTYSEADLMLIDVDEEKRLAVMHAEWLVRDYLTVDGDAAVATRVATLLPDVERDEILSYVEWAEAFAVAAIDPGQYRVDVVYRVLDGGEDGYVRQPVGALAVALAIDIDGSARLLGVPEPIAVPALYGPAPSP